MVMPDLLIATLWGIVWQLPWAAGLIIAWLLYRRLKASAVGLVALAFGSLTLWSVAAPLVMEEAWGSLWGKAFQGSLFDLLAVSALSFLGNVIFIVLVLFLAITFFWLMKDLSDEAEH